MSILVNRKTRVVVQGITGKEGSFHTQGMLDYGTKIVAGVTPGKGGTKHLKVPVFNSLDEAVAATGANTSAVFVPPAFAADAVCEAAEAGIRLIACITEGIPLKDMLLVVREVKRRGARMIGPNCPGLISPGQAKVGIMPGPIHRPGKVGVVSRSGTLTYEVVHQLSERKIGQSTCIGIGGDPIIGTTFVDAPKAASSSVSRYSSMARPVSSGDRPSLPSTPRRASARPFPLPPCSRRSPTTTRTGRPSRFRRGLPSRTRQRTSTPRTSNARARWLPTNPVAPVTKARFIR